MSKWVKGKLEDVKAWLRRETAGPGEWFDEYTLEAMSGRTEKQAQLDDEFSKKMTSHDSGLLGDTIPESTDWKESNPKDVVGCKKVSQGLVPAQVVMEVGLAMLEGSLKYGAYNYREAGVRGMVYGDAAHRHISDWQEGQDIDPGSQLNHITKAISTLVVLRDSMLNENWVDDRPPRVKNLGWMEGYNKKAEEIIARYPNPVRGFTQKRREEEHPEQRG